MVDALLRETDRSWFWFSLQIVSFDWRNETINLAITESCLWIAAILLILLCLVFSSCSLTLVWSSLSCGSWVGGFLFSHPG